MGSLSLILFGLLVILALSSVGAEEEEANSLSEELAEARLARSPDAKRRRKMRKGKGKGKGKGRAKKGMKKKTARKGRKMTGNKKQKKKNAGRRNRLQRKKARGTAGLTDTCFEQAMHYMKVWKDVVGNFEKQRKRMIKQNKTGGNKSGKKGLFAPIGHRLVDIGGGNKSNMSCGGQYGNKGALQLQNLTKTLFDCEKSVNASCNPSNFPQPNFTFINTCKELVDNFTKVATTCLGKSVGGSKTNNTDACTCWSGEMLNITSQTLKNCKANKESSAITSALKACTTAFGKCRKFEDAASTAIMSCASDSSKLTKKAANLAANNASMTAANEKMASLASSRYHSGRKSRATATSCSEIIPISTTIVKIVEQNPQSTKISTYAKKISSATVTCTAAEKTSMAAQVTSMETAIVSVSVVLTAIQEQIETLTGSTASATQLDAAASGETSTAAPGRRNRILNNLMKHQL